MLYSIKNWALVIVPFFIFTILLFPDSSYSKIAFTASPARMELSGNPGEIITEIIKINNVGDSPARIKVYVMDWSLKPNGDQMFFPAGSMEQSCAMWTDLDPVELDIPAGKSEEVRFTITIPDNKKTGGYWEVIFFESMPELTEGTTIYTAGRVGTIVYLTVGNEIIRNGTISDFIIDKAEDGNLYAKVMFENLGNIPIRPAGIIKVKRNSVDSLFGELKIPSSVVLPETNREFKIPLLLYNLTEGSYKAIAYMDYGGEEVVVGETTFDISKVVGSIADFSIQDAESGNPTFIIRFRNESSMSLFLKGQIKISNINGKDFCSVNLPNTVAPGKKEQEIKVNANRLIPRGKYIATVSLDYGSNTPLSIAKQFTSGEEAVIVYRDREVGNTVSPPITEPLSTNGNGTNKDEEKEKEKPKEETKKELTPEEKAKVESLYREGVEYFTKGDYDKAIDKWNQLLSIDPEHKKAKKNIDDAKARLAKIKK